MRGGTAALAAAALAASAANASAGIERYERPRPPVRLDVPKGFYAGVAATGMAVLHVEDDRDAVDDGGGVSAWAGIRFHAKLGFELGIVSATDGDAVLTGVTGDARVYLSRHAFAVGGYGIYGLDAGDDIGSGFQIGVGIDRGWLAARAVYRGIDLGGETFVSAVTADAGITLRF